MVYYFQSALFLALYFWEMLEHTQKMMKQHLIFVKIGAYDLMAGTSINSATRELHREGHVPPTVASSPGYSRHVLEKVA